MSSVLDKVIFNRLKCTVTLRKVLIIKGIVAIGILSAHFLDPSQAIMASSAANMLWLWGTK